MNDSQALQSLTAQLTRIEFQERLGKRARHVGKSMHRLPRSDQMPASDQMPNNQMIMKTVEPLSHSSYASFHETAFEYSSAPPSPCWTEMRVEIVPLLNA